MVMGSPTLEQMFHTHAQGQLAMNSQLTRRIDRLVKTVNRQESEIHTLRMSLYKLQTCGDSE